MEVACLHLLSSFKSSWRGDTYFSNELSVTPNILPCWLWCGHMPTLWASHHGQMVELSDWLGLESHDHSWVGRSPSHCNWIDWVGRCIPKEAHHSLLGRCTDGPEWARPMSHHIEESNCPSETHNPVNDWHESNNDFYFQLRLVLTQDPCVASFRSLFCWVAATPVHEEGVTTLELGHVSLEQAGSHGMEWCPLCIIYLKPRSLSSEALVSALSCG